MCLRFREIRAGRYMVSGIYAMADTGFNFGNYCLNRGSLGFESIKIPCGTKFI